MPCVHSASDIQGTFLFIIRIKNQPFYLVCIDITQKSSEMSSSGTGHEPVGGSCEHSNELQIP